MRYCLVVATLAALAALACGSKSTPPATQPAPTSDPVADPVTPPPDAAVALEPDAAVASGSASDAPPPDAAPPPIPANSKNVAPQELEKSRIAGDKLILPDDATKEAIQKSGKTRVVGAYKLCLSDTGAVTHTTVIKSTGFPDYDQKIITAMKGWAYKPYVIDGKPNPVCTAITFIYSQK